MFVRTAFVWCEGSKSGVQVCQSVVVEVARPVTFTVDKVSPPTLFLLNRSSRMVK